MGCKHNLRLAAIPADLYPTHVPLLSFRARIKDSQREKFNAYLAIFSKRHFSQDKKELNFQILEIGGNR